MHEAKEDVLAFRHFPKDHWRKIWSTNLLEQHEHWQLEGRRMFSAESMALVPDLEDMPALLTASA
jgi:putative transposase